MDLYERNRLLASMRREGKSLKEMSNETGLAASSISRILNKMGMRKYRDYCHTSQEEEPDIKDVSYAKERKIISEKHVIDGKCYSDVSCLFLGG